MAQQTTPETAGGQQPPIHITKHGTNSYVISGGSSSVGSFDTTYRVVGERSAIRTAEDLIISTITDDFRSSPTIGYVRAAGTTTANTGSAQDATTLPNPFATPEQITERLTSELRRVIGAVGNNTPQGQLVEIKCEFGMTLDDMRCFQAPPVGERGGGGTTTRPPPTNDTGETPELLTVQAIWDTTNGGTAPATFLLEADADGGIAPYTFHWDFGDGQQGDEAFSEHTYENPGTYTATITVTDTTGQTASDSVQVRVSPPTNDTGETTPPPTANATVAETTTPPPTTTPDTQDVPLSDPDADRPALPPTTEGE